MMPTGDRALRFASRWFNPATVHGVFQPLVADWQREWADAPRPRRWFVRVRGGLSLLIAMAVCSTSILRTQMPAPLRSRIAVRVTRFTLVGTALVLVPILLNVDLGGRWYLLLFQAPSAMVMVFPFAMILAADEIRTRDGLPPHVARAAAAKVALLSVCLMLVYGGFVVPAAGRAWRVTTSAAPDQVPPPAVRDLTTLQLITGASRAAEFEPFTGGRDRATRVRGELQRRASMALLPLTLLWLRWVALGARRRSWFRPLPATPAVIVALSVFFITFFAGWRLELEFAPGSGAGVWFPIAALSLLEGLFGELHKRIPQPPEFA